MTLDKTWEECLRMWKWISEKWDGSRDVGALKILYAEDHNLMSLLNGCFFCERADVETPAEEEKSDCHLCPGVLVDPTFNCHEHEYCYHEKPQEFYQKLLRLNAIRLGEQSDGASSNIQKN